MNVDHPALPAGDETVGNDAHESGKRDQVDVRGFQLPLQLVPESGSEHLEVERRDTNAFRPGKRQPRRSRAVAADERDFERTIRRFAA